MILQLYIEWLKSITVFLLKIGQFASKAKSKNYVGSISRTEQFLPKKLTSECRKTFKKLLILAN